MEHVLLTDPSGEEMYIDPYSILSLSMGKDDSGELCTVLIFNTFNQPIHMYVRETPSEIIKILKEAEEKRDLEWLGKTKKAKANKKKTAVKANKKK